MKIHIVHPDKNGKTFCGTSSGMVDCLKGNPFKITYRYCKNCVAVWSSREQKLLSTFVIRIPDGSYKSFDLEEQIIYGVDPYVIFQEIYRIFKGDELVESFLSEKLSKIASDSFNLVCVDDRSTDSFVDLGFDSDLVEICEYSEGIAIALSEDKTDKQLYSRTTLFSEVSKVFFTDENLKKFSKNNRLVQLYSDNYNLTTGEQQW